MRLFQATSSWVNHIERLFLLAVLFLVLPTTPAWAQGPETCDQQPFVNNKAVCSFQNNVKFIIIASEAAEGATATVELKHVSPGTLERLMAPEFSGTCVKRTGTNKCPQFDWMGTTGLVTPPYEVRIFYLTDDPTGVNPRVCVCNDADFCDCDVTGYFPFAPTDIGPDAGWVRPTDENSIFFGASLNQSETAPGVATILDPVGNATSPSDPYIAAAGSNVPLKVLLCHEGTGPDIQSCLPITDAQILVSIYRQDDFAFVFPPAVPGTSTPPSLMAFIDPYYQFNWKTPETPGLYNVIFIFLTSNLDQEVLSAWVRVPSSE